jgi:hypothetical protein
MMPTKEDIQRLIEEAGGKVTWGPVQLPDGSGAAIASFLLQKDHWLYLRHDNVPPMPFRAGFNHPRFEELHDKVREAARYAVRCATMNGTSEDFDPDALVQNMLVGLLGYFTHDGLSTLGDEFNPNPVPPLFP